MIIRNHRVRGLLLAGTAGAVLATNAACDFGEQSWVGPDSTFEEHGKDVTSYFMGWRVETQLAAGDRVEIGPEGLKVTVTGEANGKTTVSVKGKNPNDKKTVTLGTKAAVNWTWMPINRDGSAAGLPMGADPKTTKSDGTILVVSTGGDKNHPGDVLVRKYISTPNFSIGDKAPRTAPKNERSIVNDRSLHGKLHAGDHADLYKAVIDAGSNRELSKALDEKGVKQDLGTAETFTIEFAQLQKHYTPNYGHFRTDRNPVARQLDEATPDL